MSYIRDPDRMESSLPSIRSSMRAWEAQPPRVLTPYEEAALEEKLRYSNGYSREREAMYHPRPPSPGFSRRQQFADNAEQLRFYKEEISKKDRLISQLTSIETPRPRLFDSSKIDEFYSADKIASVANAKSEVAGLTVRVEGLQAQLREAHVQLEVREEKIKELKHHMESAREAESRQQAIVVTLRTKLAEYEATAGSLEGTANRSEVAIHSLQNECSNYQARILELEGRLKQHLAGREDAEQDRAIFEKRYGELVAEFHRLFQLESYTNIHNVTPEMLSAKLTDVVAENAMLKGKIAMLKEHCQSAELETKASRETIMRLVSETEREQRTASKFTRDVDNYRIERDNAMERQLELEREVQLLKERLDASQNAWNATKRELDERESRFVSADRENRERQLIIRNVESGFRSFKETMASILSDSFHTVEPTEEMIRDRITNLTMAMRDKTAHIDMLESKLDGLSKQFEDTMDVSRGGERKCKRLECEVLELQERLRKYEGEFAAGEMMRDGLRTDKERYMRFLERIVHAMKMEAITMDLGVESITDAIIARAEQLVKCEADILIDRKTHIYNLQRKLKSMKEQLESKDLHMELHRKKLAAMEERMHGRSEIEREKDEEFIKARKLAKAVDRYKRELNEARLEIRDLKARLLESSDIHSRTLEQEREIENLESKVGQLETLRQRQASKLHNIKGNLDDTLNTFTEKKSQATSTIHALSSELRTTKQALEEITKREKQLLDLRQVLARMLGLDVNSLAVPDYEIIARLEKLILANQANASTAVALDTALVDMEGGFRAGYEDASRALNSVVTRTRAPNKHNIRSLRTRSRSLSPARRRDPRAY